MSDQTREQLIARYLIGYNELSDKQYGLCRDAGYSAAELVGATTSWYQEIRQADIVNKRNAPTTARQVRFLLQATGDNFATFTYPEARFVIRNVAIMADDDARYKKYIKKATREAKAAALRAKASRERLAEPMASVPAPVIASAIKEMKKVTPVMPIDDDDEDTKDFFAALKARNLAKK